MTTVMRRFTSILLVFALVPIVAAQGPSVPSPFQRLQETSADGVVQVKGQVVLLVAGAPVGKRFVLRYPAGIPWNGGLVVGAHGGSGGNNFDAAGNVIGTDETALDDVIGRHAVAGGFAYASVDRDGAVSARDGLRLTNQFTDLVAANLAARLGRPPARRYLVGLSMGGGITRAAAEDPVKKYAGTLIVAGAGGDLPTRVARQTQLAELWPAIDPRSHPALPDDDPKVQAFAAAIGTPVAARRLWPYTATNAVNAASRPAPAAGENAAGRVWVPTIEVVGTWDDFVHAELLAYANGCSRPPCTACIRSRASGTCRATTTAHRRSCSSRPRWGSTRTSRRRWGRGRPTCRRCARRSTCSCGGSRAASRRRPVRR
jgi:hypothetical protein